MFELQNRARYVFDGRNIREHVRGNAHPEILFHVRDKFHDAETIEPEIVLNMIRGPDLPSVVDVAAHQLARDL